MSPDIKRPAESFARLYDDILENPKIAGLKPAEFGLYCAMLAYCHRNDTDGVIPPGRSRALLTFSSHGMSAALVALDHAGLVEVGEWGVRVHDYELHNETHAIRTARRNAARNAARIRWGNSGGSAESMPRSKEKEKEKGSLDPGVNATHMGTVPRGTRTNVGMESIGTLLTEYPFTKVQAKVNQ